MSAHSAALASRLIAAADDVAHRRVEVVELPGGLAAHYVRGRRRARPPRDLERRTPITGAPARPPIPGRGIPVAPAA